MNVTISQHIMYSTNKTTCLV